jgi:threonine/homoserine/homoserine lactone efflux protein
MDQIYDPAQITAFAAFSAVVAGTPGPSNALLTTVGAKVGVRQGLPSLLGQVAGMGAMLFAVTLGLGNELLAHPLALQILKWSAAALICWMAWRIATAGHAEDAGKVPAGFFSMAAFQWINPKGWLIGVAAVATFLDRQAGSAPAQAAFLAILFMLVAIPSCLPWLAFGAALQRLLRRPRAQRVLSVAMAVMLVGSTIPLIWTRFLRAIPRGPAVKPQSPRPHLLEPEYVVHYPRIVVEDRPQRALIGRLDGQQRDVLRLIADDRAAEEDDPAVDEIVGEGGVLGEEGLLARAAVVVPVGALGRRDREDRHHSPVQLAEVLISRGSTCTVPAPASRRPGPGPQCRPVRRR